MSRSAPPDARASATVRCEDCGTELAATLLACPGCRRLVHGGTLRRIAAESERAEASGDLAGAADRWEAALALLPPDSAQHAAILERSRSLLLRAEAARSASGPEAAPPPRADPPRIAGGAALVGALALLWKLKLVVPWLLGKGKLLALGLTKIGTLGSMLATFGVFWTAWGWKFALGFVLSIYVHEMGHVAALRARGLPAGAPMFVPGVGAFVRMRVPPRSPREDAYIGLAGPVFGLGAALLSLLVHLATDAPIWAALAWSGAFVNLLNLAPVWQLDGARGFAPLSRWQRWAIVAALFAAALASGDGLVLLVALIGVWGASRPAPRTGDGATMLVFALLVAALAWLVGLPLPATA